MRGLVGQLYSVVAIFGGVSPTEIARALAPVADDLHRELGGRFHVTGGDPFALRWFVSATSVHRDQDRGAAYAGRYLEAAMLTQHLRFGWFATDERFSTAAWVNQQLDELRERRLIDPGYELTFDASGIVRRSNWYREIPRHVPAPIPIVTSSRVELMIHSVTITGELVRIAGLVIKGTLRDSMDLAWLLEPHGIRPVALRVARIETYRRSVDELPAGMTGDVVLVGPAGTWFDDLRANEGILSA
ncbi:MAG: hypothetical protein QM831_05660 [Kofleriaceae bacterium]